MSDKHNINTKIRELRRKWVFNADLMTCECCGYSIIASKINEKPRHAADCLNELEENPWLQIKHLLNLVGEQFDPA